MEKVRCNFAFAVRRGISPQISRSGIQFVRLHSAYISSPRIALIPKEDKSDSDSAERALQAIEKGSSP